MNIREVLRQTVSSIAAHKLRSFLTMFGIIWGITSVILLVGLGKEKDFTLDRVRQVAGQAATRVRELGLKTFSSVVLGAGLSAIDDEAAAQALTEGVLKGIDGAGIAHTAVDLCRGRARR